jgi:thioredoxin-related protein
MMAWNIKRTNMKKIFISTSILFCSMTLFAQNKGIHFEHGLSWQQIVDKAKSEHKFIFVDCFATWCGPCKLMDKDVYPDPNVGAYMNVHFISLKLQTDKTAKDDDNTRLHYGDVAAITARYQITGLPTFLFFDSDGNLVDRDLGYQTTADFLKIADRAVHADPDYPTKLAAYQAGKRDYPSLPQLAETTSRLGNPALGNQIAADYVHSYLDTVNEQTFLSKSNMDLVTSFSGLLDSKSRLFRLCLQKPALVDSIMHQRGDAQDWVNLVIFNEELVPPLNAAMQQGKEANWQALHQTIAAKYGAGYANDNILNAKVTWYRLKKEGQNYTHYLAEATTRDLKEKGPADISDLNQKAWDIFQYDNDKAELEKALGWSVKLSQSHQKPVADELDTQAELLYKLGRKGEAIKIEQQALAADPADSNMAATLEKMKRGEQTWPDKMP